MAQNQSLQAVASKIRVRYGRFFTNQELLAFINCPSLGEFASALAAHPDFSFVGKIPPTSLSAKTLGQAFYEQYGQDIASLFRLDRFLGSPLYRILILQFTAEYLLSFARQYNTGKVFTYPPLPAFFADRLDFDLPVFLQTRSYASLIPLFGGHPFQKALATNIPLGDAPVNIARLEEDLMQIYYKQIEKDILIHKELKELSQIFELLIDLENLQKLFRCNRYFPSQTPPAFVDGGTLAPDTLTQWISLSPDQLFKKLQTTQYQDYLHPGRPADFTLEGLLVDRCRKRIRTTHNIPTILFSYVLLARHRKDCLTTIAKAIGYGMPAAEIAALLVL
ncbi:MAG: V-type ATPase subunit [Clostridia bacterium]|nr:V-type ATPase subunit [Clostridia bacterium]